MRVKYVNENNFYLISNHAVALNSIFKKKSYVERFIKHVDKYLSPLCELIGHCVLEDQFQLVVKLHSRSSFVEYYKKRYPKKMDRGELIPANTYIFSQAMANLQSSMAIHFNRKELRTGAVFARRFSKILIRSLEELECWLERLVKRQKFHRYIRNWSCRKRGAEANWGSGKMGKVMAIRKYKNSEIWARLQGRSKKNEYLDIFYPFPPKTPPKKPPI